MYSYPELAEFAQKEAAKYYRMVENREASVGILNSIADNVERLFKAVESAKAGYRRVEVNGNLYGYSIAYPD